MFVPKFLMKTPQEILEETAVRAKARRLALNLTQAGLEKHSGVSLGTIKRFERTGKIAFISLLKIAVVLDGLKEFEQLFPKKAPIPPTLDELLKEPKIRRRGRLK